MTNTDQNQANKNNLIIRDIKLQILNGELSPGARMPTRIELEKKYRASSRTVQKSLHVLIEEGFVFTRGRKGGSFISQAPPCHSKIAILFPSGYKYSMTYNVFYRSLHLEAGKLSSQNGITFEFFHGFGDLEHFNTFMALTDDLLAHKYAGVIFAGPPFQLAETKLVQHPDILRAAVCYKNHFPHIPKVAHDRNFLQNATQHLASLGCKRPGVIALTDNQLEENFQQICQKQNLAYDPRRVHVLNRGFAQWASNNIQAQMTMPEDIRPDGLVLTDDLLEEHVVKGLLATGCTQGNCMPVVALCNYPMVEKRELPIIHLGYDNDLFLKLLVKLIQDQRAGKTVTNFTPIVAQFEEDYNKNKKITIG